MRYSFSAGTSPTWAKSLRCPTAEREGGLCVKPIRVLLAEDHALVRAGIRSLLQSFRDIEIVGEAGDGREALALIKAMSPDVVLMDIRMPSLNGLEVTAVVAHQVRKTRVLILSVDADEEVVL